jgi:uncharacterized protein YegP (UPF0339 family)
MSERVITFRVESNRAKNSHWYTLVAGNGNTVMTSKAKYADKANAKRAAKDMIKALLSTQLVLEYTDPSGRRLREPTLRSR